jgi:hypothetical protein
MSIVGFNFTKINAERKLTVVGNVNITNNIQLKDVQEAKIGIVDRGALRISFSFTSDYAPGLATILLEGDVLVLVDSKHSASILAGWKNGKQLPNDLAAQVMNHMLDRCNVQALLISKDLNLPSPVPLPKVQINIPKTQPAAPPKKEEVKTTKVKKK